MAGVRRTLQGHQHPEVTFEKLGLWSGGVLARRPVDKRHVLSCLRAEIPTLPAAQRGVHRTQVSHPGGLLWACAPGSTKSQFCHTCYVFHAQLCSSGKAGCLDPVFVFSAESGGRINCA